MTEVSLAFAAWLFMVLTILRVVDLSNNRDDQMEIFDAES